MNCDKCNIHRKRKLRPYGMKMGLAWFCPRDECYSPNWWFINPKIERQNAKNYIRKHKIRKEKP